MHRICWMVLLVFLSMTTVFSQGELEKLPLGVNTDQYDESAPILSKDGSRLFFTRTASPDFETTILSDDGVLINELNDTNYHQRLSEIYSQIAGRQVGNPVNSVFNQDIWVVPIRDDSIGIPYHPGYPLNNALPNSLVSTGMNPDEFVVINQFFTDGSMYSGFSRVKILENGEHTFPQPMHIYGFDVNSSDVNLTMSPGGLYVILSLERPGTIGKNDLYVSFYMRDNVWSELEHMGNVINTEFQETTPHISPDRRFLYFSSNRPGGLGGNDIYVSERMDYTWLKWSKPVLLKGEINSTSDDSQPSFTSGNNYMYFTSRRDGSSDLFRVRLTPKPKLKKPIYIKGRIVDSKTGQLIRSELLWGPHSAKSYLEFFNSYNGLFEALLIDYEPYKFLPRKPGHYGQNIMVDPRVIERSGKDTVEIVLYLDPKEVKEASISEKHQVTSEVITSQSSREKESPPDPDRKVFMYDIYFVKAKPIILTKSANALKQLLYMMESNPAMEIRVEGHTDNVGDEKDLIDLSYQRAAAIRDYLVLNGIATERIRIEGFGATRPIHQNDTEAGREKNRRVEITITRT